MMQNLGGHERLARPIEPGNHNQNRFVLTCYHCEAYLRFLQLLRVPHA